MRTIVLMVAMMSAGCSCSTLFSSKSAASKSSTTSTSDGAVRTNAARIQAQWQSKFEGAVSDAGAGAEGWALFADSAMGHTGQQLVIRRPDNSYQLCYATAATGTCTFKPLDAAKWTTVLPAVREGDSLSDRTLQVFDGLNAEYLHLQNDSGQIKTVARVFFMIDDKVAPPKYDQLMDAFINLPKS